MPGTREFRSGDRVVLVHRSGDDVGPVYVLVHGLGMDHDSWNGLADALGRSGRVYALDMPGFGDAPKPAQPLSMAESGDLLAELLRDEGLTDAVLVGHSTGAQVIAETAARHPELVSKLVLIGPTVNPVERTVARQTLRFLQDVAFTNPKVMALGIASYMQAGPRWYAENLRPMVEHDIEVALERVTADTLVVRAEHDRVVPRYWAEQAAALAPNGRVAEVPGRGHETMITAGPEVAQLIARHAQGEPVGRRVTPAMAADPTKVEPVPDAAALRPIAAVGWWILDELTALAMQLATPFRMRAPARFRRGDPDLPTVVLLPGVYEHWSFLRSVADELSRAGYRIAVVRGLGPNRRPVVDTSERLARALARVPTPSAGRVIVSHSKGGLIAKHLLLGDSNGEGERRQGLGPGLEEGERGQGQALGQGPGLGLVGIVTVCTPFAGSSRARIFLDPSIRAFLPDDETIVQLGAAASVNARIVSVFGTYDPHVPSGSVLEGATNIRVPVTGHFRILLARETSRAVRDGIGMLMAGQQR
ncbi:MAG TPA: alpha/beta fold hydrolase [Agromyces sp.]|nr:alpha/beta fold hydrolase [Agromyces sp.]